jgi:DNA replication and repair protein RecF
MRLTHLALTNFRNYARLELDLPPGPVLLVGQNAQGKTNLLEAVYLLATTRSLRASSDTELIRRDVQDDPLAAARVVGQAQRRGGRTQVDVAIARRVASPAGPSNGAHAVKRLRVNGVPHRAAGVVGHVLAVLFTSLDIDLITGPPAGRRRYLDITLSQLDPAYLRALQRYTRVVQQRNSLLRQIDEGRAGPDQLASWDEELVTQGATIVAARAGAIAELNVRAARVHQCLSDGQERLAMAYLPQLGDDDAEAFELPEAAALRNRLRAALGRRRRREIAAGVSLIGPHRDDLRFTLDGESAAAFGSRAQQRTVALALRLAEAELLEARSGEAPVLLLDDILSELDERRRTAVLSTIASAEQCLITTADLDRFTGDFVRSASIFSVSAGTVELLTALEAARSEGA